MIAQFYLNKAKQLRLEAYRKAFEKKVVGSLAWALSELLKPENSF
jgi:hypothetical protein